MPARTNRLARTTLIACLAAAAVPAAASASTVSVSGSTLTFNAASHEANDVVVQKLASSYRVSDNVNTLTVGAGCTSLTTRQANCPLAAITLVRVNLFDQDDLARMSGVFNSQVFGGQGTDELTGGGGNDLLGTGPGVEDRLLGGAGNDTLDGTPGGGPQVLLGGSGNDVITAGDTPGDYSYSGFFSHLVGGPGTDTLTGSSANELFLGGTENDTMTGGTGGSSGFGGPGLDFVRYDDHTEGVTVNTGDAVANDGGPSDGAAGARDKALQMEGIIGSNGVDHLTGSGAADTLMGLGGGDVLLGGLGHDQLCGDGFVSLSVDSNQFFGGCSTGPSSDGNDNLNGGDGNDGLMGNGGADTLIGGTGSDFANWQDKSTRVVVTLGPGADGQVDIDPVATGNQPENDQAGTDVEHAGGGSGADTITGSTLGNLLLGGSGQDILLGGVGADTLCGDPSVFPSLVAPVIGQTCPSANAPVGAASGDTLNGGDGDDRLQGNQGPDVLNGDLGVDTALYTDKSAGVVVVLDALANDGLPDENPAIAGNQAEGDKATTENVIGGFSNDTLTGSGFANALTGGEGTDTLNGAGGNDVLDPGGGLGDTINGGLGFDYGTYAGPFFSSGVTITLNGVADDGPFGQNDNFSADVEGALGTRGPDTLRGPTTVTANTLVGYGGSDTLDGKLGDDALTGGPGFDSLLGDAGNDLLSMADGETDTGDCGAGTADRVMHDATIETPTNCETLQPVAASAASASVADPRSDAFRAMEKTIRSMATLARR